MAAASAASIHASLTAAIMVFELSGDYLIVLPLILSTVVATAASTLCGWVADVATALTPVGEQLRREVLAADYLQTDDTSVTVLDDPTASYKGRLGTYLDPLGRQVVFDATRTHERDGPDLFLADFRGKL
jgi:hypothetical protein